MVAREQDRLLSTEQSDHLQPQTSYGTDEHDEQDDHILKPPVDQNKKTFREIWPMCLGLSTA
jgi:hypothetical protein